MRKILCLLIVFCTAFVSCDIFPKGSEETTASSFDVILSDVYFGPDGGVGHIAINSAEPVNVTSSEAWCKVELVNLRNIAVYVDKTNSFESRYAQIRISQGDESVEITAQQTGVLVYEFDPDASLSFGRTGGKVVYPYSSSSQISLKTSDDWIVATVNEDGVSIFVTEYKEYRSGYVMWSIQDAVTGVITINQDGEWKDLGKCSYTDGFISAAFKVDDVTYDVDIQESYETPNFFRLVNPYGAAYPYNEPGDYDTESNHYMYVHAEDKNNVYIVPFDSGCDWSYGSFLMTSTKPGTYANKVITFPVEGLALTLPKYSSEPFPANVNGSFKIDLSKLK